MEAILGLIFIVVVIAAIRWLISAGFRTVGAAGKAVLGKGSFSTNMELAFKGMGPFEIRFENSRLNEDGTGPLVKKIQGKGMFPLNQTIDIGFITSVFDKTSDDWEPIISVIEGFQEENTAAYQHSTVMGEIKPNHGFVSWAQIGVIIPEILEPPYSGARNLVAIIRMVDLDDLPNIERGYHQKEDPGILWQNTLEFNHTFEEKGYIEATEHRDEAVGISLKIGMAVALADGSLDDSEGTILKDWIIKNISHFSDEKKTRLKKIYNDAMRDSYAQLKAGELSLSNLIERLNEIGEKKSKYAAVELCLEVMSADGVASDDEIKIINSIAESLNIDPNEFGKMRDQQIVNLDSNVTEHASIEIMLGIKEDWSNEMINKHLRIEFQKWNNRLNTLLEGEERQNAQIMIDRIAEARKKYA